MPLLIAATVLVFFIAAAAIYAICVSSRIKSEQEEHCAAMNNPYRIVLVDGYDKYRIQHYEFSGNGETGWRWMNTTESFTDPDAAKKRYCELMAEFRYQCENEKPKVDPEFYLKNIRIHKILDMSDTIELTNEIIKKLREEREPKRTNLYINKAKAKAKPKAKVEEPEVKKPVRRRKKTDD